MNSRSVAWRAWLALALAACQDSAPRWTLPDEIWRGERVAIASDARALLDGKRGLCAGALTAFDAQVESLEQQSGLSRTGRARVYVLEDEAEVRAICGGQLRGRCYDPELRATVAHVAAIAPSTIEHELVHDFADHTGLGRLPGLLSEGLATLWGTDSCSAGTVSSARVATLLALDPGALLQRSEYALGAIYVDWLLQRYGAPAIWKLFGTLRQDSGLQGVRVEFERALHEPFDDATAAFEAQRPPFQPRLARCGAPASQLSYQAPSLEIAVDFDCGTPALLRATPLADGRLRAPVVVEVPEDGEYAFEGTSEVAIEIQACDCSQNGDSGRARVDLPTHAHLTPGRYRFDLFAAPDSQATISMHEIVAE